MEEDPSDIEGAVLEAFAPLTIPSGSSLRRVLVTAFDFATIESSPTSDDRKVGGGRIVIDGHGLFKAVLTHGLEVGDLAWSSAWLVRWLQTEGIEPRTLVQMNSRGPIEPRRALRQGGRISISDGLRSGVIPDAQKVAIQTSGSSNPSLRHVHFALLRHAPLEWFGPSFTAEHMARLKEEFIERNRSQYEDESVGWEKAANQPAREVGAESEEGRGRDYPRFAPGQAIEMHPDTPGTLDQLGRQAFAQVLASRIIQVGAALRSSHHDHDAFMLQLDGPWGSGKTTILNFLKEQLRHSEPPWLVVEYNAWRNQHRRPPWWPLVSQVGQAVASLSWKESPRARWLWAWWRFRMRWVPVALIATLVSLFVYFSWRAVAGSETGLAKALLESVSALLALVTLTGLAWTATRKLSFGSVDASEAFTQSTAEPYRRIIQLFSRLVRVLDRPIAIFIDDLDRCDSEHVIELLEGIQTRLRAIPAVYVVAGDRKWISSSFDKHYADFSAHIGARGRPLSHLFLHKVFQVSASVPRLSARRKESYLRHLLGLPDEVDRTGLKAEVALRLSDKTHYEDLQAAIEEADEGSLEQEIIRAEAAKRITTPEAEVHTEHRLQKFAALLEPNPRAMKLLLNALALVQAAMFLEGRDVPFDALARWTIIELRWPLLAGHIDAHWPDIAAAGLSFSDCPGDLADLLRDPEVRRVFGGADDADRLTIEILGRILS